MISSLIAPMTRFNRLMTFSALVLAVSVGGVHAA